jgi:hypothetical protein
MKVLRERAGLDINNPLALETYAMHDKWVRAEAGKQVRKVLDWQAEEGWTLLPAFLGKPAPNVLFPGMNG